MNRQLGNLFASTLKGSNWIQKSNPILSQTAKLSSFQINSTNSQQLFCIDENGQKSKITNNFQSFKRNYSAAQDAFQKHVQLVQKLKSEPENDDKLALYALFKQSTDGPNTKPKPGALDFVGKYKWQAWTDLGQMSKEEAQSKYIQKVQELVKSIGLEEESSAQGSSSSSASDAPMVITVENQIKTIRFNRPTKKNAFTPEMYVQLTNELNEASKNDKIKAVFLTGTGDYYSSGNDLSSFMKAGGGDIKKMANEGIDIMIKFIDAFIECEKPVIAAVNGHAVGILVTTLGLCDVVIASDQSSFHAPFGGTAQTPEGCSSYTFPRILGPSVANHMLLFNRKLNPQEALTLGLVAQVVKQSEFDAYVKDFQKNIVENCATHSVVWGKKLLRSDKIKEELRQANRLEAEYLRKSWFTPEFPKFIAKFFQRKK